jgi:hypothetical protein
MPRRRRRQQDDGLIQQVLDVSIDHPETGLIGAGGFAVIGAVLWFVFPTASFGLMRVVAVLVWCLAGVALFGTAVGWVIGRMRAAADRRRGASAGPAAAPAATAAAATAPPMPPAARPPATVPPPPVCPRCRVPMVGRVARAGAHAGRPFWGCPRYPACKQIVNVT